MSDSLLASVAISDGTSQRECMHECLLVRFILRPYSMVPLRIIVDFQIVQRHFPLPFHP